jgi:homotetrameric cytidine deaminase
MAEERTSLAAVSAPRRNIEVKAMDGDPARSEAVCRQLGAQDRGVLVQRDTYFRTASGRLKLREEEPGGATLVQYHRPDAAEARLSSYRLVPVEDPGGLRASLDAALGTLVIVEKERHLFLWEGVRIHLDRVRGLGTFVELEGVAPPESDLAPERARVAQLTEALGIGPDRILTDSYSDRLLGSGVLVAAARAAMERAYAPYSGYRVGAALRADDGSIHVGANVENAAYPQGQCAEASAIGALVAAGRTRIAEAAVIAGADEVCVPCGGCRQRLRELMPLHATVHLCGAAGAHVEATLEELLPRSFGPEDLERGGDRPAGRAG